MTSFLTRVVLSKIMNVGRFLKKQGTASMSTTTKQRQKKSLSRRQRIARRIATYSVAAGAIALAGEQAQGAIVHKTLNQVFTDGVNSFGPTGNEFDINMNNPGPNPNGGTVSQWVMGYGNNGAGFFGPSNIQPSLGQPTKFAPGAVIGQGQPVMGSLRLAERAMYWNKVSMSLSLSLNPFPAGSNTFLGLKFKMADNQYHYGWARITFQDNPNSPPNTGNAGYSNPNCYVEAVVTDLAYESVAGQGIGAGEGLPR